MTHMETQTPEWLTSIATIEQSPAFDTAPAPTTFGEPIAKTRADIALMEQRHLAAFEPILDRVALGHSIKDILADRPEGAELHQGALIRWIKKDPERLQRFRDAQEIGAEVVEDEMIAISDGNQSLEDVARSTLRVKTRQWVLEVRNRKRYAKDAAPSNPFASGGITINIGAVQPPDRNLPLADTIDGVIDV